MRWSFASLPALLIAAGGVSAEPADIYGYTDAAGVLHLTNVPTGTQFALLARAPAEPVAAAVQHHRRRAAEWMSLATNYAHVIDRAAQRNEVHPALLRAVIAVESAFNPTAVSTAGARGLMQLYPTTAKRYGVHDAFDPEQNVGAGARYLSDLLHRYDNNLELALAAYNAGEDAVDRAGRQIPPYRETRQYVPAVMRLYREFLANTARTT